MNDSKNISISVLSGASFTSTVPIERFDSLMVYLPNTTNFGAASIEVSLYAAYDSAVTADAAVSYYDYGNATTDSAKISAAAGGLFEMPWAGSPPAVRLVFNTACTAGATIKLVYAQN